MLDIESIAKFRQTIYNQITVRRDANLNLLDALSSHGHQCKTVIELSESEYFERKYSSVTDAIADGLPSVEWKQISQTIAEYVMDKQSERVVLITDTTPQPRQSARCVEDRHITYSPNPAPGNKPITVGHEYSTVSLLPNDSDARDKHWLVPLDTKRVKSDEKGNEVGMSQISHCIENLGLSEKLVISVADSKYGTEACRKQVNQHENWVHLFRINSTRKVHAKPEEGSSKHYGCAMKLNDEVTHITPDDVIEQGLTTRSGQSITLYIKVWRDVLFRGSRQYKGCVHPVTILQISATDMNGKSLYKNPLWVGIAGERRHEITALEAYQYYNSRYDIEHYFRFGKDKLLFDKYQTPDVEHEQAWWQMAALAYSQLYLARKQVPLLPKPWERYLQSFQQRNTTDSITATPSQTQRGFSTLLNIIGTPAKSPQPRGNPKGRAQGETQTRRTRYPVIFKNSKQKKVAKNKAIKDSEKPAQISEPQSVDELLATVKHSLQTINVTPEKFYELLQNNA